MIRIMRGLPDNVLGVLATGKITGADYETVLIPALEEKLKSNAKIRMLYHIDNDFTRFDLSAMWDDAKLGMKHMSDFERVALVSDHEVLNSFAHFLGHLMKAEVRVFKENELENAKKWIVKRGHIHNRKSASPTLLN